MPHWPPAAPAATRDQANVDRATSRQICAAGDIERQFDSFARAGGALVHGAGEHPAVQHPGASLPLESHDLRNEQGRFRR
jgi:hypothetical protein